MSDIFVGLIAIGELVAFVAYVYLSNKEKTKLVNALISKNAQDMTNLTLADQTQIKPEVTVPPDLIPTDEMNDEKFDQMIQEQLNGDLN